MKKLDVMASLDLLIERSDLVVADSVEYPGCGFKILLYHRQIQIRGRFAKKRGGIITLREQGPLQRYRRNSLTGEEIHDILQVMEHPLMADPALGKNPVAPDAFRWGDVRT